MAVTLSGRRHRETPHSLLSVSFLMPTVLTPPSPDLVWLTNPGTLCVTCPSLCICSLSKSHDVSPAVPHGSIPFLSFLLPPAWLQMGLSFVLILQCQLLLLPAQAAHHLLVYISGSYIKCSLNVLWSIQNNLVRTGREKAHIYLLSCRFSQMNELNIFIAFKINYLPSPGQL